MYDTIISKLLIGSLIIQLNKNYIITNKKYTITFKIYLGDSALAQQNVLYDSAYLFDNILI